MVSKEGTIHLILNASDDIPRFASSHMLQTMWNKGIVLLFLPTRSKFPFWVYVSELVEVLLLSHWGMWQLAGEGGEGRVEDERKEPSFLRSCFEEDHVLQWIIRRRGKVADSSIVSDGAWPGMMMGCRWLLSFLGRAGVRWNERLWEMEEGERMERHCSIWEEKKNMIFLISAFYFKWQLDCLDLGLWSN